MGQSDDVEDSTYSRHQELCQKLNMDASAASDAWISYSTIRQNYTLEVSFFVYIPFRLFCPSATFRSLPLSQTSRPFSLFIYFCFYSDFDRIDQNSTNSESPFPAPFITSPIFWGTPFDLFSPIYHEILCLSCPSPTLFLLELSNILYFRISNYFFHEYTNSHRSMHKIVIYSRVIRITILYNKRLAF